MDSQQMKNLLLLLALFAPMITQAGWPPNKCTGANYIQCLPGQVINASLIPTSALSPIPNGTILGNTSGTSAPPSPIPVTGSGNVVLAQTPFIQPVASASPGIIIQGLSGQAGDLQDWNISTGATVAKIDALGDLMAINGIHAGKVTAGPGIAAATQTAGLSIFAGPATNIVLIGSAANTVFTIGAGSGNAGGIFIITNESSGNSAYVFYSDGTLLITNGGGTSEFVTGSSPGTSNTGLVYSSAAGTLTVYNGWAAGKNYHISVYGN